MTMCGPSPPQFVLAGDRIRWARCLTRCGRSLENAYPWFGFLTMQRSFQMRCQMNWPKRLLSILSGLSLLQSLCLKLFGYRIFMNHRRLPKYAAGMGGKHCLLGGLCQILQLVGWFCWCWCYVYGLSNKPSWKVGCMMIAFFAGIRRACDQQIIRTRCVL